MTPCYQRHELAPGVHADVPHEHEGVAVKSMAEVIQTHHMSHADWDENQFAILCHCGTEVAGEDDGEEAYLQEEALYATHLADALTAAGFGPIKAAAAGALRDAASSRDDSKNLMRFTWAQRIWLRKRAATIEAPDGP